MSEAEVMKNMIHCVIDGVEVEVEKGSTILEAAYAAGVRIPTLCYLKDINKIGSCRMCVVEVKGARSLVAACTHPVSEGMEVLTATPKVLKSRKTNMELILSNHRKACLVCERNHDCELRLLAAEMGIDTLRFEGDELKPDLDESAVHLIRDNSKCILCRRCIATCKAKQQVAVIGAADRGFMTHIESPFGRDLAEVDCVHCGQCIEACPTGALQLKRQIDQVKEALVSSEKTVIAVPAPAVRVGLGDRFGMGVGEPVEGKMVAALKRLGFDYVFDVDWGADLTIMEEGTELIERLSHGGTLPLFTSCCPAWVKYCEMHHPELLGNLSSCRSPQQMIGGVLKTWWAERQGVDLANIVVVSIMPCTAKKFEITREEMRLANGQLPVDYSLTTRELEEMIAETGMMFDRLPDVAFDEMLGESSGAAVIFGATGGVMEAALRTASVILEDAAGAGAREDAAAERADAAGARVDAGADATGACVVADAGADATGACIVADAEVAADASVGVADGAGADAGVEAAMGAGVVAGAGAGVVAGAGAVAGEGAGAAAGAREDTVADMGAELSTSSAKTAKDQACIPLEYHEVRGLEGVREASYKLGGVTLRVAVVSGLTAAEKLLQTITSGERAYDFVEVMCCPSGCVNGGGQPLHSATEKSLSSIPDKRAAGLYALDEQMPVRRSLENSQVKRFYDDYAGAPGSHKAHEILHTSYVARSRFAIE